jgi:hypothetical protein
MIFVNQVHTGGTGKLSYKTKVDSRLLVFHIYGQRSVSEATFYHSSELGFLSIWLAACTVARDDRLRAPNRGIF